MQHRTIYAWNAIRTPCTARNIQTGPKCRIILRQLITYPPWFASLLHSFKGSNFRFHKEITLTYFVVASGIERTWPKWISLHSVHYKATISAYNLHSRAPNQNFARASRAREARALYLHPEQQNADFLLRIIRTKSLETWSTDSAGLDLPKAHLSSSTFHRYRPLPSENLHFFNFCMKIFILFDFSVENTPGMSQIPIASCPRGSIWVDPALTSLNYDHFCSFRSKICIFQHPETRNMQLFRTFSNFSRHRSSLTSTDPSKAHQIHIFPRSVQFRTKLRDSTVNTHGTPEWLISRKWK